jgi:hypothetical protein
LIDMFLDKEVTGGAQCPGGAARVVVVPELVETVVAETVAETVAGIRREVVVGEVTLAQRRRRRSWMRKWRITLAEATRKPRSHPTEPRQPLPRLRLRLQPLRSTIST